MITEDDILQVLQGFGDDVAGILLAAGYFNLSRKNQILEAIPLGEIAAAANIKNSIIWRMIWPLYAAPGMASGIRKTAGELRIPPRTFGAGPYISDYYNKHGLELVRSMNATDVKQLKDILEGRFWQNEKPFAREFKDSFPCSEWRLRLIKRSESHAATCYGSHQFALTTDAKKKTWHSVSDRRTRAEHRAMNGETVGIRDRFSNGLEYPNEPGCRCHLSYSY